MKEEIGGLVSGVHVTSVECMGILQSFVGMLQEMEEEVFKESALTVSSGDTLLGSAPEDLQGSQGEWELVCLTSISKETEGGTIRGDKHKDKDKDNKGYKDNKKDWGLPNE